MTSQHANPPAGRTARIPGAALGLVAAIALAGCTSGGRATAGSGAPAGSSAPSSPAPTSTATARSSTTTATTARATASASGGARSAAATAASNALARELAHGVRGITSAHVQGAIASSAGTSATIVADEKLSNGKVTALDLTEKIGGQTVRLILVGRKAWAKLPSAVVPNASRAKPWLTVTSSSKNPTIRVVAAGLARTSSQTSLDGEVAFARAATKVEKVGHETIDGVSTTRYALDVATARLPASTSAKALVALGVKSVPTQMWIDGAGRPVRVSEKVTARSVTSTTTVNVTRYNRSVSVNPPPAGQIAG